VAGHPVTFAGYLALRHPRLFSDYVRWVVVSRRTTPGDERAATGVVPMSPGEARALLRERLGDPPAGPALELVRGHAPRATAAATATGLFTQAGDASLGELAYTLVRGLRPTVVVETGVAHGITSAYILAGLDDNALGELHSIDLPSREMIRSRLVGTAVPRQLRSRWTYHWGPSSRLLPPLLRTLPPGFDLFVHDSDHRYANMRWELESAWEAIGPGGWVVADDAEWHAAFQDVAVAVGAEPLYVTQLAKPGWTGLMQKHGPA
jgi:predicted O-methyltransferase YrrM